MAIIPAFFLDAVVALGTEITEGQKVWVGTGFLLGRKEKTDPDKSTVYIITNKHVVKNQKSLYVRFNNLGQTGVKDLLLDLEVNDERYYSEHPNANTDIVAIQINPNVIIRNNLRLSFFDEDKHALTLEQMMSTGVEEGSLVYALGFPMNLVNDKVKAPICRLGCIARVADAFLDAQKTEMFLVDAQTFPGNSGGPIISRPEHMSIEGTPQNGSANLIGILSAYIPYRDTLVSQQTKQAVMIREENSGLTIVHPVDRIREVVELEWERAEAKIAERIKRIKEVANPKSEDAV